MSGVICAKNKALEFIGVTGFVSLTWRIIPTLKISIVEGSFLKVEVDNAAYCDKKSR